MKYGIFDNIQYEFTGFDPEYETQGLISSVASQIRSLAPSDSAMKVAMKKGKHVVKASCQIFSKAGVFVANSVHHSPVDAIKRLEKKMVRQFNQWKKKRFVEDDVA